MENEKRIKLKCKFCNSSKFSIPDENYPPKSGDFIKCSNCGGLNSYDSLMKEVDKEAENFIKEEGDKFADEVEKQLKKTLKF